MSDAKAPLLANATRDLAVFAAGLKYEDIPSEAVQRIKSCLLDSLGCCLFGATLPWTRKVADMVMAEGARPVASLMGMGAKSSVALAALVNGTAGHAFELDDIHKESILHPGSLATPVALAIAEAQGATRRVSGREVITAMTAGYEVGTRVGNAATMSLFFRGFHPQGTSGAFVAAATAARALGLDAARFQHALGIAGSQGAGLMAAQEGAMVKRFHCGRAAQSGVYAAQLAQNDFTGIPDVIEAPYGGFLSSLSDKPNPVRLTEELGKTWETLAVGYKPHASVTSIHTSLDGLLAIMQENALKADHIKSLQVGLSRMTHVHCAWEYKAQGVTAAQMNLFYGLAVIAIDGVAFTDQYREERLRDPRILAFIPRVSAFIDDEIEAKGPPLRHAARLKLETTDGRIFERMLPDRRGSPENPLKPEDLEYKFRHVTASCVPAAAIDRLVELADRFESLEDVGELVKLAAAPLMEAGRGTA
jgi:2-methylcitrate dehydratase PrpD